MKPPTDPTALLEAAKREAHDLKSRPEAAHDKACRVGISPDSRLRYREEFDNLSGHLAVSIDRALRIAERVARYEQAKECYDIYNALAWDGDNPKIEPALREERDRLLAELEGRKG